MMDHCCRTCAYSHVSADEYTCRRLSPAREGGFAMSPPPVHSHNGNYRAGERAAFNRGVWPEVRGLGWCGQYKKEDG